MEDLSEEAYRRSIYEVSRDIRRSKEAVSRLLYIGSINVEEKHHKFDIGEETSKWLKERNASATGLVIISGNFFIHIVEDTSEVLFDLVYWVKDLISRDPPPFKKISIISFTEENPSRIFSYWSYISTPPLSTGDDDGATVDAEEMIWQLYNNISQVGIRLSKFFVGDQQPTPSGLAAAIKSTSKELIPTQETLALMLGNSFSSIEDFISIYIAPMDIVFENELVWPPPPELTF